jgi:hypothetical protein
LAIIFKIDIRKSETSSKLLFLNRKCFAFSLSSLSVFVLKSLQAKLEIYSTAKMFTVNIQYSMQLKQRLAGVKTTGGKAAACWQPIVDEL